jgi:hypothetical protein
MVYNDTSNKNGIIQRYERHSQLGDGVVSGDTTLLKQVTADINETVHELTNEIILAHDNFDWDDPYRTDYPVATTPLTLNRDYQFDNISFLKIKRVDVSYDRVNYYRANAFDSATYQEGLGNDTNTDANFSKTNPFYDPKGFGFWLYPKASQADIDAGGLVRVEFFRTFDEYTYDDTTKEPPIDRPFHDLIAIGAALKNPTLTDKQYQKLQLLWQTGLKKIGEHYGSRNEDFPLSINPQLQDYS